MPAWLTYLWEIIMPLDAQHKKLEKRVVLLEKQQAAFEKWKVHMSVQSDKLAAAVAAAIALLQDLKAKLPNPADSAAIDKSIADLEAGIAANQPPAP